jgi:hypothetical protein
MRVGMGRWHIFKAIIKPIARRPRRHEKARWVGVVCLKDYCKKTAQVGGQRPLGWSHQTYILRHQRTLGLHLNAAGGSCGEAGPPAEETGLRILTIFQEGGERW